MDYNKKKGRTIESSRLTIIEMIEIIITNTGWIVFKKAIREIY